MHKKRRIFLGLILCLLMLMPFQAYGAQQKVMVIPLEKNVEMGLSAYLERNFQIAEEEKADLIIIEMDTPGGRVDAAQDIKRIIYGTQIPTIALVEDQAISAGAYIALACDQIAMTPGSTLGMQRCALVMRGRMKSISRLGGQNLPLWRNATAVIRRSLRLLLIVILPSRVSWNPANY